MQERHAHSSSLFTPLPPPRKACLISRLYPGMLRLSKSVARTRLRTLKEERVKLSAPALDSDLSSLEKSTPAPGRAHRTMILTRGSGALFDPLTAPEPASTLESDFEAAWVRNEASLRTGPDNEVAWPPPGAALGGATTELAAALVFGAVSSVGRGAGVADG